MRREFLFLTVSSGVLGVALRCSGVTCVPKRRTCSPPDRPVVPLVPAVGCQSGGIFFIIVRRLEIGKCERANAHLLQLDRDILCLSRKRPMLPGYFDSVTVSILSVPFLFSLTSTVFCLLPKCSRIFSLGDSIPLMETT